MDENDTLNGQEAVEEESQVQEEAVDVDVQEEESMDNLPSMAELLDAEEYKVDLPQRGEIRTGIIASIGPSQILVSIGAKSEGVIAGRALDEISPEVLKTFEAGQEIKAYVLNPEDKYGNVILSYTRAIEVRAWSLVDEMLKEEESYEGKVCGYNKGGLLVDVEGLRGFVPASQVSAVRRSLAVGATPEQRWAKMHGEPIVIRVIEVDRERRRLILSERAASNESRQSIKERVIEGLEIGESYTGRVTSLANFGAFVNVNGADGLVHLSEISWERVKHPSEVLEIGQEVTVKVISIDEEKKRIGLSLRQLQDDPWKSRIDNFQVGELIEGTITRLTKFGAFAQLEGDIEGLIHVSEISDQRIEHPKEELNEGDVVILRIIRIEADRRRIGLSMRKVDSAAYVDKDMKALAEALDSDESESEAAAFDDAPVDEPVAEASPVEEAAAAEEAVAEEAPVEEAVLEEAPVEETVVEEAKDEVASEEE
ncbi:MAG: S1 RNA-binding domain-containing protein [Anaerolineales bacterium]|uniref:S1 RNA-binding domain-containing protein n=1 Tax=Candidatus Desulfolinea nitratireducens TaxID=2841698 RepID=A0A8J6NMV5_9CHLR|nr:S1 RNA-binding domain-containing protein [Candidatus Desulfolinea nitratireducens]MBL6961933.1 S1 RNA-binding domain-containing protein [Anaerolineales bacterium]